MSYFPVSLDIISGSFENLGHRVVEARQTLLYFNPLIKNILSTQPSCFYNRYGK